MVTYYRLTEEKTPKLKNNRFGSCQCDSEITAIDGEFKINVACQFGDMTSDRMLQENIRVTLTVVLSVSLSRLYPKFATKR